MEGPTRILRGCFFCKSGKEADVIDHFITTFPNGKVISPTRTRIQEEVEEDEDEETADEIITGIVPLRNKGRQMACK